MNDVSKVDSLNGEVVFQWWNCTVNGVSMVDSMYGEACFNGGMVWSMMFQRWNCMVNGRVCMMNGV